MDQVANRHRKDDSEKGEPIVQTTGIHYFRLLMRWHRFSVISRPSCRLLFSRISSRDFEFNTVQSKEGARFDLMGVVY